MKKLLFLMAFVVLMGCDNGENGLQEVNLGVNTTAGSDESVVVRGAERETTFSITIVAIGDCRCPSDVVCVHGGWANVDFRVEGINFSLLIGQSKEFSSGGSSYRLTLLDVTPYPTTQNFDEKKKAIFIVEMI